MLRFPYTVVQTFQINEMCSVDYGAAYYKEPLRSFDKKRA